MKKKLILAAAGLLSILTLSACSSNSTEIATMKGGKITVEDFYEQAKTNSTNQSLLQQIIVYKAFENAYGDDVTTKQIDAKYDEIAKQYGDTFETQLQSAGYTKKTYKAALKQQLAFQAGLKDHVEIKDADLKTAWDSYHPEVTARIITASSEDDANAIKKEIDGGKDFADVAKDKSTDTTTKDDGGKVTFDSTSTTIPAAVQTAAWKLKNGEVSDVISSMDSSTYQTTYYIVKMEKTSSKGNDMDKYKKELKEIATNTQLADSTFQNKVIGEVLKAQNVKIKDTDLSSLLSTYMDSSSDSAAATDSTDSSAATSSSTADSAATSSSSTATSDSEATSSSSK